MIAPFPRIVTLLLLISFAGTGVAGGQGMPAIESQDLGAQPEPAPPTLPPAIDAPAAVDPLSALEAVAEKQYTQGNLEAARELYRQLADLLPEGDRRIQTLVLIAWLDHLLGRFPEARATLEEAAYQDPSFAFRAENYTQPFVEQYTMALESARRRRRHEANELVRQAVDRLRRGLPAEARELLGKALVLQPDEPNAAYNLAFVDMQQGATEAAIAGFERLLSLAASGQGEVGTDLEAQALNNLGVLYYGKGYFEDARRHLERAVKLAPEDSRGWSNLGLALRRLERPEASADAFRRAYDLAPNDESAVANLALVYLDTARWVDARALLSTATERLPQSAVLWLDLGIAERGLGNTAGAVAAFRRALDLDAQNRGGHAARAAAFLALLYHENGQPAEAVTAARQALAWKPTDAEALTYLGLAQQTLGDLAAARDALEQAAQLAPDRAELHNNLGTIYFDLGDDARAEASFSRALALRPEFPAAAANLDSLRRRRAEAAARPAGTQAGNRRPRSLGARFSATNIPAVGLRGLLAESVTTNGIAAAGGLRKGDLVLLVDGKEILTPDKLDAYVAASTAETLVLDILRESRPLRVTIKLR